jgi:DNA-binding NarL/FixJ family response regulator
LLYLPNPSGVKSLETDIRVLLADDHPLLRQGLRQAVEAEPRFKVVAEAGDGNTALEQIRRIKPDIAVLDVNMPQLDGFAVARAIRDEQLPVEIIFLTVYRERRFLNQALELGAKGYVLKDSAVTDIVAGIRAVVAGEHFTSPAMTSYLINRAARGRFAASEENLSRINSLTPTERRILKLIAAYKTSKEIADELCISFRTVNTHRANICQKLEIRGNHALMKFALDHQAEL